MALRKIRNFGFTSSLWILSILVCLSNCYRTRRDPLVANTPLGRIRGHTMTSRSGREFLAFSGIPYAKPPIGELRFEPPLPVEPWQGVKDALEDGPWCLQWNTFDLVTEPLGVEDCLRLSVYSHKLNGSNPVLVHFHGGGFISGNGAKKTGPQYLMDKDLVIVDVNYRVSFFGFLTFEDLDMPGNQAMKDQVLALKWVQKNIASFGGDPNKVTIIGESAGAGSVYHHTVSPLSKGLFHRAVAESGSSYCPWAINGPGAARNASMWLLSLVGCPYTTTKDAVACLKKVDGNVLVSQLPKMSTGWESSINAYIGPTLEPQHPGAFLVGPISQWKHEPVPLLTGVTSAEGLIHTLYLRFFNASYEQVYRDFPVVGVRALQVADKSTEPKKVGEALRQYYFPGGTITERDWVNLTTVWSDSFFDIGMIDGVNRHSGDSYVYYFDYLGFYSQPGNATVRDESILFGAFHTDEIIYLWYNAAFENLEGQDLELSKKLVKLIADFATHGNPTPRGSNIKWNKWSAEKFNYLNIDKTGLKMKNNFIRDRYNFWKSLKYNDKMK